MRKIFASIAIFFVLFSQVAFAATPTVAQGVWIRTPDTHTVLYGTSGQTITSTGTCGPDAISTFSSGAKENQPPYWFVNYAHADLAPCFPSDGTFRIWFATSTAAMSNAISASNDQYLYYYDVGVFGGDFLPIVETSLYALDPEDGDVTPSAVVPFSFKYFLGTTTEDYTLVGLRARNISNPTADFAAYSTTSALSQGFGTFYATTTLTEGEHYIWQAFFRDEATGVEYTSSWLQFDVVTASGLEAPVNLQASSTSFSDFLNVPTLLKKKAPFAYLFEIAGILQNLDDYTASTTGILTYDFAEYASGTPLETIGEVTLFSSSTVTQLLPQDIISIFRGLAAVVVIISGVMYMYHDIRHHTFS